MYGLKNLTTSLKAAFQQFLTDAGVRPKLIRTDFDYKLMGKNVTSFLNEKGCIVESAPLNHQHQNGLVERHCRTLIQMVCSWLTSTLLPSSFWFHAIKKACEVSNYLPINLKRQITSRMKSCTMSNLISEPSSPCSP